MLIVTNCTNNGTMQEKPFDVFLNFVQKIFFSVQKFTISSRRYLYAYREIARA